MCGDQIKKLNNADLNGLRVFLDSLNCMLCLLESRLRELYKTCGLRSDIVRKFLRELSELDQWRRTNVFVNSFELITKISGVSDPHEDEKYRLVDKFLKIYDTTRNWIKDIDDAFKFAVNANLLDVEMHDYKPDLSNVYNILSRNIKMLPAHERPSNIVRKFRKICYVLDNSGEHIFDIALAEMLKRRGMRVTLLVREKPYEIDVTREIVEMTLEKLNINMDIVEVCGRCPPVLYAVKEFDSPDTLIISKGIANLEAYIDWCWKDCSGSIMFLLVAKCGPIARFLDVEKGTGIAATSDYINSRIQVYSYGREDRI